MLCTADPAEVNPLSFVPDVCVPSAGSTLTMDEPAVASRRLARRLLVVAGLAGGAWLVGAAMDSGSAQAAPVPAPSVLAQLAPVTTSLTTTAANVVASVPTPAVVAANPVDAVVTSVPATINAAVAGVPVIVNSVATSVPAAVTALPATVHAAVGWTVAAVTPTVDTVVSTATATVAPVITAVDDELTPVLDGIRLGADALLPGGMVSAPSGAVVAVRASANVRGKSASFGSGSACSTATLAPIAEVSSLPQVPPVVPASPSLPVTPAPGATLSSSTGSALADRLLPATAGFPPPANGGRVAETDNFVPAVRFDAPTFSPD
ncbi:MAG: hypothetical protein JWM76_129 [Pseudonocardiales bacterium]|nr:hypothetical protein [Pseudonocardiales bacterium]